MLLSFKETISGKPTYFIEQIWLALIRMPISAKGRIEVIGDFERYADRYFQQFGRYWDGCICSPHPDIQIQTVLAPKLHTIRAGSRFSPGDIIHFCVNPRSKIYFQFAPVRLVVSAQLFDLKYTSMGEPVARIDGQIIAVGYEHPTFAVIARNDGFLTTADFFKWFKKNFTGQIIHWTPLRY